MAVYIGMVALFKPNAAPALPTAVRDIPLAQLLKQVAFVMLPPLALIIVVLGSIFFGGATPTEAGALGGRRGHDHCRLLQTAQPERP